MSDRPLDPVGEGGRRRAYARALSGAGDDPYTVPRVGRLRGQRPPGGFVNPLTGTSTPQGRGMMMAEALSDPEFQPLPSLRGFAPSEPAPEAESETDVPGAAFRISTRVPTAVGSEELHRPHSHAGLEIGLDAARESPDAWAKNANLIRGYSHIRTEGLNDDEVHEAFVNHLADNLVWLHNRIDPNIRASSKRWYDGARRIAEDLAQEYGIEVHQAAGILAALSPQKDWFQNVDLAKRLLEMNRNAQNFVTDDKMRDRLRAYVNATKDDDAKRSMLRNVRQVWNKSLAEIDDPYQKALWLRAHDEAHNPREYRTVTPEGGAGDYALTKGGKRQKVAWGSFKEIHKAMQALADPSLENISRNMGGNHKVRNFYNNIIAPNHGRDVTIDTHAIAAANLIPAGSNHELVKAGLGLKGAKSAATGARGLYAHYAEAHRRAAERLGILPRELQSITWEGIRGFYTPEQKRDQRLVRQIENIWHAHGRGDIDANTAREQSLALAAPQGIRDPKWLRSGSEDDV